VDLWKRALANSDERPGRQGLLTKLHGSVNWLKEDDNIIFAGTGFKGHQHHAVIYPGFKGAPREDPFSLFHSYFEAAIQRAELIVVIGFAFRDEHINACFERNVGTKIIHVIDPATPNVPKLATQLRHIKAGFQKDAIDQLKLMVHA
jgi:hypothetical protein